MSESSQITNEPKVSVLLATYNRRRYLPVSLSSIVHQDYRNLEIFVIRDGGEEVGDIVDSFNDSRIVFIDRKDNCGLPHSLNEAIARATGKYICYLGDDDLYYPHHVSTLVDALENKTDCLAAYSDLYKTYCRVLPGGERQVLGKFVEISRDFDRFMILYFNHVLHVSLMHHRQILEKTGLYNDELDVLIDWDMTRRLAFFTDFLHTCEVTGEFYSPVGDNDRISFLRRKDEKRFTQNVLAIRTTRPAKPWSKLKDLSIIVTADVFDAEAGKTIGLIWQHTFYPYKVYLPVAAADLDRIKTDMPNLICVPAGVSVGPLERFDIALKACEGEFVAVVPRGFALEEMWIEEPVYALGNCSEGRVAIELEGSNEQSWAVVLRKEDLLFARESYPALPVRQSLVSAGIEIRRLQVDEIPFKFDSLLKQAKRAEDNGDWPGAAEIYEYTAENFGNRLWMRANAARAYLKAGKLVAAEQVCKQVNAERPTAEMLLLGAKIAQEKKDYAAAISLLQSAEDILERTGNYGKI